MTVSPDMLGPIQRAYPDAAEMARRRHLLTNAKRLVRAREAARRIAEQCPANPPKAPRNGAE